MRDRQGAITDAKCADCAAPTDATICHASTRKLGVTLGQATSLLTELETTALRQSRIGAPGRGAGTPLPWNESASDAAGYLRAVLWGWARILHEDVDHEVPITPSTYLEIGRAHV